METASSLGQKSVSHQLGAKGTDVEPFLTYIKERFPVADGYQFSRKLDHFYDCDCSITGGCTEWVTITFL